MKTRPPRFLDAAALLAVLGLAAAYFSFVTVDPDLWGHIKFGEDLWRQGAIPQTDPYSFTAHGERWINHEWLSELIFYLTYRHLGDAGLLFGKLAIGILVVLVLYRQCAFRERHPVALVFVMALAAVVISPGFMIRPQLFSFLWFTLTLHLLHLFFVEDKNRLFLLPPIMLVWVNLHGGFLMGGVVTAAAVGWGTFRSLVLKKRVPLGQLWLWSLLAGAATLANPYGTGLMSFFASSLAVPRQISEWRPLVLTDLSHLPLKALALLFLMSLCLRPLKRQGWQVVCGLLTLYAAVRHQRHMPFFAIAAAPLVVGHLSMLASRCAGRFPSTRLSRTARTVVALFFVLLAAYLAVNGGRRFTANRCRIVVNPHTYPVAALRFIADNDIGGNLILPFSWGEYAIWKLYPRCRVSIDGRFRTVYPEAVIRKHFVARDDRQGWEALIETDGADLLLSRQIPFFQQLADRKTGPWVYVYSDPTAILFLRDNTRNAALLRRFREGRLNYAKTPPVIYFPG